MNREEIKTYFETLAQDSGLEVTNRIINKFVNLTLELFQEGVEGIEGIDEIKDEFLAIAPDDNDEWMDFIDEATSFVVNEILDEDGEPLEENE